MFAAGERRRGSVNGEARRREKDIERVVGQGGKALLVHGALPRKPLFVLHPFARQAARENEGTRNVVEGRGGSGEGDGDRNRGTERTTDREKGRSARERRRLEERDEERVGRTSRWKRERTRKAERMREQERERRN